MRDHSTILLLDLDSFFASVEMLDKPSIRDKPVVVGGQPPRGVVSTANYAARRYGVNSGMSIMHAIKMCPKAVFLRPRGWRYKQVSEQVWSVAQKLDVQVEQVSVDEAFIDLEEGASASKYHAATVEHVGRVLERLRQDIKRRTGVACSGGGGSSKLVAKLACEAAKPNGQKVVAPGEELLFLHPLPVRALWGVGVKTAERLNSMGIITVRQLAERDQNELVAMFGNSLGGHLHDMAWARDNRPVEEPSERQSIGAEQTYDEDEFFSGKVDELISLQARECARRLRSKHRSGRTITVKAKLSDFRTLSKSVTLPQATADPAVLVRVAQQLVSKIDTSMGVRLLGVSVSHLGDTWQPQLPLFPDDNPEPEDGTPYRGSGYQALQSPYTPGEDVLHDRYGRGWVLQSDEQRTVVAFETRFSGIGPRYELNTNDPFLHGFP